jgi:hypothetical protein
VITGWDACYYTAALVHLDGLNVTMVNQRAAEISPYEIVAEARSNPAEQRESQRKALVVTEPRPHAVCTVQTFRNAQTGSLRTPDQLMQLGSNNFRVCSVVGAMLYMFIAYYQLMGWRLVRRRFLANIARCNCTCCVAAQSHSVRSIRAAPQRSQAPAGPARRGLLPLHT